MTEEQKPQEPVSSVAEEQTTVKPEGSIVDELTTLGKQAADALKAAWDSPERKRLQMELTEGLERFAREVGTALDKASESAQAKELRTKAAKVAEDSKVTDAVDEVRKGLLTGLEAMNRELGKLLERLEAERTAPAAPAETAAAPVSGEPPAERTVIEEEEELQQ